MRVTQLRHADLNLLVVFSVLAEERNVSRAAKRLLLSQPAVSRALQRLRERFTMISWYGRQWGMNQRRKGNAFFKNSRSCCRNWTGSYKSIQHNMT
jgi:hypothetical protein